jgi:hypothetical protein
MVNPFSIMQKKYYQGIPNLEINNLSDEGVLLLDKTLLNIPI